jgi:5'-3' exonuclease
MLHLIDSSIYIFRAWQTLPASILNRFDEPANAVHGFTNTLVDIITNETPTHLLCAFDESLRSGIRHSIYPPYKANRPPAPPELKLQFQRCKEVVNAFGVIAIGSRRVEADDIVGQFAEVAHMENLPVTIITGDKDLAQFIRTGDVYWNLSRQERYGVKELQKRFGVHTHQIADLLALCGDKTDNIPGVPGVGQTTAARLLVKWGNLETLFANTDKVAAMRFRGAPRVSALLSEYEDTVRLSRQLTGLVRDESLVKTLSELKIKKRSAEAMAIDLRKSGFSNERAAQLASRVVGAFE